MTPSRHRFVVGFCLAIALAGVAVAIGAVAHLDPGVCVSAAFAVLLAGVVLGELVPLKLPLRGGPEEVNLSTPFSLALLLVLGLGPAIIAQAAASLVQDVVARKPAWRCAFNVGQYVLCLAAAGFVLDALGRTPGHTNHGSTVSYMGDVLLAGGTFYLVNFLIVAVAVAAYQGVSLGRYMRADLSTTMLMAGVSVSLAPLIVAALDRGALLLALFVLPFVALHQSGRAACDSAWQATHDALTGLPNRVHFGNLVGEAIAGGQPFTVMLLDLNRFKDINDTLGHHYGDVLLEQVAMRLVAALRPSDVIARLGGDEFALQVLGGGSEVVASRLAEALRPAVEVDGILLEVDASIGTARYPEDGESLETLLRRADVAMYAAKERHLTHVAYTPEIDEYDPARLSLVSDLRRGLGADELVLHFQPKLSLADGHANAVEALVRWEHPTFGLLQPGAFVEMAEHTGLIKPLTDRVLALAMRQAAAWREQGLAIQVAVNVSARSLLDRGLPDRVAEAIAAEGLTPAALKLEITESAIMVDPVAATQILDRLAEMGVALSVDDYGTGYSSLAYLRRLPVSEVKIDRSFVKEMIRDEGDRVIVTSTVELAANLGLQVVAEGVEDRETLEELARLGCGQAQGFHISRPVPADELTPWLREHAPPRLTRVVA